MKYLKVDIDKCFNCDLCADVCSLVKLGRIQPSAAAIKIRRVAGGEYLGPLESVVCDRDCPDDLDCVAACPSGALEYDDRFGVVRFDADLCTECLDCLDACEKVVHEPESGRIIMCDTCDGEARCAEWCPEGAISLEDRV